MSSNPTLPPVMLPGVVSRLLDRRDLIAGSCLQQMEPVGNYHNTQIQILTYGL